MDTPHNNRSEQIEPKDRPAGESAKQFFPNIATVRAALEAAQIGVWSWDVAGNRLTWSSNLEPMHGMPAGGFARRSAGFVENIYSRAQGSVAHPLRLSRALPHTAARRPRRALA